MDKTGEALCRDPATKEQRRMAFQGFESDRGALKYRCPAAAYGFKCQGRGPCYRGAGVKDSAYGRVVRIALADQDRRVFTPTLWGSPSWRRGYKRRTALERINSRIDSSFGFERCFIRGQAKMKAYKLVQQRSPQPANVIRQKSSNVGAAKPSE